jgi:polysaccharide biosynthesis protein VpsM
LKIRSITSSITLLGLLVTPAFAADLTDPADSTPPSATTEPAEVTPAWGATPTAGSVFGQASTVSVGQQSVTSGYELGGSGIASGGSSAEGYILTEPMTGRPIRFDNGIFVSPSVQLGFGHNDNILGTTSNKLSSNIWVLNPKLVTELKHGGDRYTISYLGSYGMYDAARADDYYHHEIWAAGDNHFTGRARLGWGIGYLDKTDARGATNRVASGEPDHWHAPVVRALGIYGAPGAIGRVEVESSWMQKRYENNRAYTESADVDLTTLSGRFFYRIMPRTSLIFEARNTWANYVSDTAYPGDNMDTRLYVGATWDATAKTSGTIKVGRGFKSFTNSAVTDSSLASWEGSVRWSPLTYSTFDLVTSRSASDSSGIGSFVIDTGTALTWNHKWASYISSRASVGLIKTSYENDSRRDDTKNFGVGFFTELGYHTRAGIDWSYTDRKSNVDVNDFKRNVLMLTAEFVL